MYVGTLFNCTIWGQSGPEWVVKAVSPCCTWSDVKSLEYRGVHHLHKMNNIHKCTERWLFPCEETSLMSLIAGRKLFQLYTAVCFFYQYKRRVFITTLHKNSASKHCNLREIKTVCFQAGIYPMSWSRVWGLLVKRLAPVAPQSPEPR